MIKKEQLKTRSRNIKAIGFVSDSKSCDTQGTLYVDFRSGAEYEYYGVPRETFLGLLNTEGSPTGYFNDNVRKPKYNYRRTK